MFNMRSLIKHNMNINQDVPLLGSPVPIYALGLDKTNFPWILNPRGATQSSIRRECYAALQSMTDLSMHPLWTILIFC